MICELKCPSIFLLGLAVGNGLQSAPGDVLISQKMVLHGGLTVVLGVVYFVVAVSGSQEGALTSKGDWDGEGFHRILLCTLHVWGPWRPTAAGETGPYDVSMERALLELSPHSDLIRAGPWHPEGLLSISPPLQPSTPPNFPHQLLHRSHGPLMQTLFIGLSAREPYCHDWV